MNTKGGGQTLSLSNFLFSKKETISSVGRVSMQKKDNEKKKKKEFHTLPLVVLGILLFPSAPLCPSLLLLLPFCSLGPSF